MLSSASLARARAEALATQSAAVVPASERERASAEVARAAPVDHVPAHVLAATLPAGPQRAPPSDPIAHDPPRSAARPQEFRGSP